MDDKHEEAFDGRWYSYPIMRNALLAAAITVVTLILKHLLDFITEPVEIVLFALAIVLGGYHWVIEGLEELIKERKFGIELLMMAATIGSAILGMWDEAVLLVILYAAAEGLEEFIYAKTRGSIKALLDLAPKEARVLKNKKECIVPAEQVVAGDIFVVKPGESIVTDGEIVQGQASVNEAAVTGESVPVEKTVGMKVFAATLNQDGLLCIKATANFANNTLSKMIHLVEEAQTQKGRTQLFIERFGNAYSPLVLAGAVLLIVFPWLLGLQLALWAYRAVVVLVAAAPCALVMSTPVAIAAGIGKAGTQGILIKGGMYLEKLGTIKAIAFDKTGTLTMGKPIVTDVVPLIGSATDVLQLAASINHFSEHPLGKAIAERASADNIACLDITKFKVLVGQGAEAKLGALTICVGKPELFKKNEITPPIQEQLSQLQQQGKTVVLVGGSEGVKGIIALRDEIRPEAQKAMGELRQVGIIPIMLTGDHKTTAMAIAHSLGIQEIQAELKPEDKIKAIATLETKYGSVAMVGDGINDAPALARATVGIAMGAAGTDAAIEAAQVVLMGDDLHKIPHAFLLGKRARTISRQNIIFSIIILAALIPSALLGIMGIAIAVVVHELSEILAVLNGLRVGKSSYSIDKC